MKSSGGRLPRIGRVDEARRPPFRLTPRDIAIVEAVYHYRALSTPQIETQFFASRGGAQSQYNSRCRLRLQMLYHAGYLLRDEQAQKMTEGRKPLVYWLDYKGAELLAQRYELSLSDLDWNPRAYRVSHFALEHLLATNGVRIAINISAKGTSFVVSAWIDDASLRSQAKDYVQLHAEDGSLRKQAIVPDGYFILESGEVRHHQFLETDMGTTTGMYAKYGRRDWARKVAAYLQYYRSGKYQERYGTRSMRVLTVTTSEKRLANLKGVTEKVGGKGRFWFTTFERVREADVLADPIWVKAGSAELYALI